MFSAAADVKGHRLVCYTGNAFYVRKDVLDRCGAAGSTDKAAYAVFLSCLSVEERERLYLVKKGLNPPYYRFRNSFLDGHQLGLGLARRAALLLRVRCNRFRSV